MGSNCVKGSGRCCGAAAIETRENEEDWEEGIQKSERTRYNGWKHKEGPDLRGKKS